MSKESVSQDYLASMKSAFAEAKQRPTNQNVLVTGATRPHNIGRAIIDHILDKHWGYHAFKGDIRIPDEFPIMDDFTSLICCHGVNHMDWFEDQPISKIADQITINLTGTAQLIQRFVNNTLDAPYRKTIVVMGSMAHRNVLNGSSVYCASKAGLAMLMRCLAWELAPKGYDVYCIHPSNVQGAPMSEDTIQGLMRYRSLTREAAESYWGAVCPSLDGFLTKDEIARLTLDLITGEFPYLSGSQIELVGGQR